jgi:hypothetical protein
VWLEPAAVVNWVPPPPVTWSDLPYFLLRWSDAWNRASLRRFREKWGVTEEDPNGHYAFVTAYRQRLLDPVAAALRGALGWRRGTWAYRRVALALEGAANRLLFPERRALRR